MSNPLIQRSQSVHRPVSARGAESAPTPQYPAAPAALPKVRRKAAKPSTAKAFIAVASLAITLSGWALLAAQEASPDQGVPAVAYAQSVTDSPMVDSTNAIDTLRQVTLPSAVNQTTTSPASTNNLRVVTAPPVSNSTASRTQSGTALNSPVQQPRLRIRTRSSR